MSKKNKFRKMKKPRSLLVMNMLLICKSERQKDKRNKRNKSNNLWKNDYD